MLADRWETEQLLLLGIGEDFSIEVTLMQVSENQ